VDVVIIIYEGVLITLRLGGPLHPAKFHLDGLEVWVYGLKNFENLEFYQYNCPQGADPLRDSYKIYRFYARPQYT